MSFEGFDPHGDVGPLFCPKCGKEEQYPPSKLLGETQDKLWYLAKCRRCKEEVEMKVEVAHLEEPPTPMYPEATGPTKVCPYCNDACPLSYWDEHIRREKEKEERS